MMNPVENIKIPNFQIFEKKADLIYYDGPLLSHLISPAGEDYIFYWVDVNEKYNKWIVFQTTPSQIEEYLNKKISLRQFMFDCLEGIAYSIDIDNNIDYHNVFAFNINTILPEYLPTEDSYHVFEVREYPARKKTDENVNYVRNEHEKIQQVREEDSDYRIENSDGEN
ncbi:DUF6575 domain-containing protein [Methanolapillus millepedarum]|uniref:DUF6575 domain-containing protein n=1 Tax=Methanolapillus millepedarum TaxID=3028296 RepID=A0AA96V3M0_9EURY|nr:hypothetical protein MsAc7_14850 [Methanosarcinaceae archaeon Ac7]